MNTALQDDLGDLVFCVGTGGVGKTTVSAALAVHQAMLGKRVFVLTADPAKRLADALGVPSLRNEPTRIEVPSADASGGVLYAAMLETKDSFDEAIRRTAGPRAGRVLSNPIYQAFSKTLARSHAYAAMERIHSALNDERFDLVIVDTPPAQSALHLLDAPFRLLRFMDQRVVQWFLRHSNVDASSLHAASRPGALAQKLLARIAGNSAVDALSEFMGDVAVVGEAFAAYARAVSEVLRTSRAGFLVISGSDNMCVMRAEEVIADMTKRGFDIRGLIVNRAFIEEPGGQGSVEPPIELAAGDVEIDPVRAALRSIRQAAFDRSVARIDRLEALRQRYRGIPHVLGLPETGGLVDVLSLGHWFARASSLERRLH